MRRRILIVLFALGTIGGYSSGIASLRHRSHCHRGWSHSYSPERAEVPPPSSPR